MARRIVGLLIIVVISLAAFLLFQKYQTFYEVNVPDKLEDPFLHIPTGSTFEEVVDLLKEDNFINDVPSFIEAAEWMNYLKPIMRPGRFEIQPGWNNHELVRHLRGGKQSPVKVVLTNQRLLEDVAEKVARFIETDSSQLIQLFHNESFIGALGYSKETLMTLFIPNTYEFFWNTSPEQFLERMVKEHKKFWEKEERAAKAEALEMEPWEVYTLASIMDKETNKNTEKPRMAGVYLNRIEQGILLQADPTCVFATRDFNTRRVTNYHTSFDSPYNTYLYPGLPPGPISMATIASIDAVLNHENHRYIFFCARGDGTGLHSFAVTLKGHNQNVARYVRNLKKRGKR